MWDPNYRATDEHWAICERDARYTVPACILELRARIEALEAEPQQPEQSVPPAEIFPVEYADSDGEGIRILMEPGDAIGRVCWVVRNSRHVNPCHEFSSPEDAYAAHRRAQLAAEPQQPADHIPDATKMVAPPAPAGGLVKRLSHLLAKRFSESQAGTDCTPFACDVLREVAAWLEQQQEVPIGSASASADYFAAMLRSEANR